MRSLKSCRLGASLPCQAASRQSTGRVLFLLPITRKGRGFTLIELLSAILILAVLIAIGIPTMENALIASRKMKCLSKLRQLHTVIMACAGDHRGEVPVDRENVAAGNTWYMPLQSYIYPSTKNNPGYNNNRGIFFCPTNKLQKGWTNYAINSNLYLLNMGKAPEGSEQQAFMSARSAVRFQQHLDSETVLLLDSGTPTGGFAFTNPGARYDKKWVSTYAMHGDSINVLFMGGNIASVRVTPRDVKANGDLNELKAEWFWPLRFH